MGATTFYNTAIAKTAVLAFRLAQSAAEADVEMNRYDDEDGDYCDEGGYSGTILEKSGFQAVTLPPRVSAAKFFEWIEAAETKNQVDPAFDSKAEVRAAERAWKKVPDAHKALVQRATQIYSDKWGPALCVELRGAEAKRVRDSRNATRGKVFVFAGWASE